MIVPEQKVKVRWNGANKKQYISRGYNFTNIGDEFLVDIADLLKSSKAIVKATCDWCTNEFKRAMDQLNRKNHSHHFCSNKCQHSFRSHESKTNKPEKKCEECGKIYKTEKYNYEISRFCSSACLSHWQSKAFKGENSPLYVDRVIVKCDWCNSKLERTPNYIKTRTYNFCNMECKQKWHAEIYVKSNEFIKMNRKVMLRNISEGKIKTTETEPHLKINEILKELEINYKNEKIISDYSFDIYLTDFDLFIEVNGGYWHCDNRKYKEINYTQQLDRIIKDKRKRTYLLNNYKKNVLYLWEDDINKNLSLCIYLIIDFISNNGVLENYHSMNYSLTDNKLSINREILIPYMEVSFAQIESIVNLEIRRKVTGYNEAKHITFNCQYCGNKKTQSIINYMKAKSHFCSIKCKNLSQQIGNDTDILEFIHNCKQCDKEVKLPNYRHLKVVSGEQKNVFCSQECKSVWESVNIRGLNNPNYNRLKVNCQHCGKEEYIAPNRSVSYKYCSNKCKRDSKRKRIKLDCNHCGIEIERTPSQIKKSKNHFCSSACANKFRSEQKREDRICDICGESFNVRKTEKKKLCSVKCQGIWQSKSLIGKNANKFKHH